MHAHSASTQNIQSDQDDVSEVQAQETNAGIKCKDRTQKGTRQPDQSRCSSSFKRDRNKNKKEEGQILRETVALRHPRRGLRHGGIKIFSPNEQNL